MLTFHITLRRIILISLLSFGISTLTVAQDTGGLHLYAGASYMKNAQTQFTPEGQVHSGHHFGGDFTLVGGGMYFLFGVQLHNTDLIPSEEHSLADFNTKLLWVKPRGGLGFTVLEFGKVFVIRAKALVSLDMMIHSQETAAIAVNPTLNDGTASAIAGLGVSVGPIRIDAEYHKGLVNAYSETKGSSFDFFLLNAGFFF